jgi:hypothetical protein
MVYKQIIISFGHGCQMDFLEAFVSLDVGFDQPAPVLEDEA